jgi:hypothetical protein
MNPKSLKAPVVFMILALLAGMLHGTTFPVHAAPGDTTRVSVDSSGAQGNGFSRAPSISGDGRYVAFESEATNFGGGTGGVFVHDRQTGQTAAISAGAGSPSISADSRFVAFESSETGLVAGDANGMQDIFVYDRQTTITTRVSVDSSGVEANGNSASPDISGDGRFVAFTSSANNLVAGDANGVDDVFVHDLQTGATELISLGGDGSSNFPAISGDGRFVAFLSSATSLVSGDTNAKADVFVRDRQAGITTRVSVTSGGLQADNQSFEPDISADGRYTAFGSSAQNLVGDDALNFDHVYLHDNQTGATTRASVYSDGSQMIGESQIPSISSDGRFIAFQHDNRGDGQGLQEIFLHDRQTGNTTLASVGIAPMTDNEDSAFSPSISADGRFVSFASVADQMVAGDTNGVTDVFVHEYADEPGSPTVVSITRANPNPTSANSVQFIVTFSEVVSGVGVTDFTLTTSGGITGAAVTLVGGSGKARTVTVNTGAGDGTLRLDLLDDDSIKDTILNPLGGAGAGNGSFAGGEVYAIDRSTPLVSNSVRADPNPTDAATVHFTVTFSESVSGVDVGDFILTTTGNVSGATITDAVGSGNVYTIGASTGSGDGTLRLDVSDNDSIVDGIGNPLGGVGAGNGNFSGGEAYTIDRSFPVVTGSLRADANPTAADSVRFTVTFSKAVTGVDAGDFALATADGVSGVSVSGVSGSGNTYTVTVATGSGDGSLRLDVVDNDSIMDSLARPLGGPGIGNGNFTTGETYTIKKSRIVLVTETFRSNGTNDGWVLESGENSGVGGSKNATANTFKIGDDAQDRQYRTILHFPTHYLPDNAVVTQVILVIKAQGVAGTDPFTTHQNISIDIRGGYFGSAGLFGINGLDLSDFQAPASMSPAGVIQNNPVGGWYWSMLDTLSYQFINRQGVTQLRLMFQTDDNDDLGEDSLNFFSGNTDALADRPHLLVEYYAPR